MIRLFFILILLFAWNEATQRPVIAMKNILKEFEMALLDPNLSIVSNNKSIAVQNNNPCNLKCFRTGEFRMFNSLDEEYAALLYDLNLKITVKSIWTDSTTTIYEFINIYAPTIENDVTAYLKIFYSETGLQLTNLLNNQNAELIARGIIKVEDVNLYHKLYSVKSD